MRLISTLVVFLVIVSCSGKSENQKTSIFEERDLHDLTAGYFHGERANDFQPSMKVVAWSESPSMPYTSWGDSEQAYQEIKIGFITGDQVAPHFLGKITISGVYDSNEKLISTYNVKPEISKQIIGVSSKLFRYPLNVILVFRKDGMIREGDPVVLVDIDFVNKTLILSHPIKYGPD